MTITCDGQCPKFNGTGCELLLHYDKNNNGIIDNDELIDDAGSDYENHIITEDEFNFIGDAARAGSINALCSNCYSEDENAITCDGQCPKFNGTGCELLLHYDSDDDGTISMSELGNAINDKNAGIITEAELAFVQDAYYAGSINALCSGCYTEEGEAIFRVIEFTAPSSCEAPCNINIHIKWQNVGTASGVFVPKYEINNISYTNPLQMLEPNATYTLDDTVSITSAGTYEICPYPNE